MASDDIRLLTGILRDVRQGNADASTKEDERLAKDILFDIDSSPNTHVAR